MNVAKQQYGMANIISHGGFYLDSKGVRKTDDKIFLPAYMQSRFGHLPFISGHFGYDFAKHFMANRYSFTFLRDPAERILSFYYFCQTRDPNQFKIYDLAQRFPLDEFLTLGFSDPEVKGHIWNHQVCQLAIGRGSPASDLYLEDKALLELAIQHLDEFSYVGFTETFEEDCDNILMDIRITLPGGNLKSNVTEGRPYFNDLPESSKKLLLDLTELDRQLYEQALSKRHSVSKNASWLLSKVKGYLWKTFDSRLQSIGNKNLDVQPVDEIVKSSSLSAVSPANAPEINEYAPMFEEKRSQTQDHKHTIAVVIHAFYETIFDEILGYLENVHSVPLKLYVTSPIELIESLHKKLQLQKHSFYAFPVINHGRDILPFLKIMPEVIKDGHDLFIKVHSKKSVHREDGDLWRADVFEKLLSESALKTNIDYLANNPEVGILGPTDHIVPMRLYMGSNLARVTQLAGTMGVDGETLEKLNFVPGTMFFARTKAIIPLLNLALIESDFEAEAKQVDGTLAHAVERLFAVSAYAAGLTVGSLDNTVTEDYRFRYKYRNKRTI